MNGEIALITILIALFLLILILSNSIDKMEIRIIKLEKQLNDMDGDGK